MALSSLLTRAHHVGTLLQTGAVAPVRPDRLARLGFAFARWGPTPATGVIVGALRHPDALALVDELGALTWAELNDRTDRLARGLATEGLRAGDGLGVMCRNHRGFVEAVVAGAKVGCNVLLLNTSFAAPQLRDVCQREDPRALIFDAEFTELLDEAARGRRRFVAWRDRDEPDPGADATLDALVAAAAPGGVAPPPQEARITILTSGTTGTPKGANRVSPTSLEPAAALLSKIPLRARETTMIACPLFHSWGLAHWSFALGLGSTVVLRRRFDPEETLRACAQHRASALVVVPVMLQRIVELGPEVVGRYDLRALRAIAVSGSALPGPLATRVMDLLGDKLYNLYGSTEVAWATIATPQDLRAAPGTAGRPPRGTRLRLVDEDGRDVPPGQTGRIFVGNSMLFEGYTGGGTKDVLEDGTMATGDVGHLDAGGRLQVDGRDDDMIVSGGENVFTGEVEDLLAGHEAVAEVAVVGVPDEAFGQRLKAVVVRRPGAALDEQTVKGHVKANLAGFKVPREVAFVDELPRNATGKVLKRQLR